MRFRRRCLRFKLGLQGFYLGPAVPSVTTLLVITWALSVVPLVLVFVYCPVRPRVRSSQAVVAQKQHKGFRAFALGSAQILWDEPSIVVLMVVTGLGVGIYDAWIGVLPQILDTLSNVTDAGGSHGHRSEWDSDLNGLCGMAHTGACILGMWSSGHPSALRDGAQLGQIGNQFPTFGRPTWCA